MALQHLSSDTNATVEQGDTVLVGDRVYGYGGPDANLDLSEQDYGDIDVWFQITALQQDYGDTSLWQRVDLELSAAQVRAYIVDSSIDSGGALTITASDAATIDAIVIAASAAISAGVVGASLSGAGVGVTNRISTEVQAFIDGDGPTGITASSVKISATDSSGINAIAGAGAIAAGFGAVGAALSIAVTIATNEVANDVAAFVANADQGVETTGGPLTISATSLGRPAFDPSGCSCLTGFTAEQLDDAATTDNDDPETTDDDAGTPNVDESDEAEVDRIGDAALRAALADAFTAAGLSLATFSTVSSAWKYTSEDKTLDSDGNVVRDTVDLVTGDLVRVARGYDEAKGVGGQIYRYKGSDAARDLSVQDYLDTDVWQLFIELPRISTLVEGSQWVLVAPDGAAFILTYDQATSQIKVSKSSINAVAAAVSVALGIGFVGIAISGAGAVAQNVVLSKTVAYITDSRIVTRHDNVTPGPDAPRGDVILVANSSSVITATIFSVALAVGGGAVGAGLSVGVAMSRNYIGWRLDGSSEPAEVRAFVRNSTITAAGDLTLRATDRAKISALVFAAAAAVAGGAYAGLAGAGSGVVADNRIKTLVFATIEGGPEVTTGRITATNIELEASDTSVITAFAGAIAGGGVRRRSDRRVDRCVDQLERDLERGRGLGLERAHGAPLGRRFDLADRQLADVHQRHHRGGGGGHLGWGVRRLVERRRSERHEHHSLADPGFRARQRPDEFGRRRRRRDQQRLDSRHRRRVLGVDRDRRGGPRRLHRCVARAQPDRLESVCVRLQLGRDSQRSRQRHARQGCYGQSCGAHLPVRRWRESGAHRPPNPELPRVRCGSWPTRPTTSRTTN